MSKPNTPIDRGSSCTALAKRPRELVRAWGSGTIDDQRAALLRVLAHRHRKLAIRDRLRAGLSRLPIADKLRMMANGMLHAAAAPHVHNITARALGEPEGPTPDARATLGDFLLALQLFDAAEQLETPGEN